MLAFYNYYFIIFVIVFFFTKLRSLKVHPELVRNFALLYAESTVFKNINLSTGPISIKNVFPKATVVH